MLRARPDRLRRLRSLLRDRAGNVAVMSALLLPVILLAAALAVDQGSLYFERREAQGLTDLAAITAAANIGRAKEAAMFTMTDNRQTGVVPIDDPNTPIGSAKAQLLVEPGRYAADPGISPENRFTAGAQPRNAVRVTYRKRTTLYFGNAVMEPPVLTTVGIAATSSEAAVSIGSRLASVSDGLLNALLGKLLGANLSLKTVDYRAMLDADVDLISFLNALSTELQVTAGTYDDLLDANATIGQFLRAVAASLSRDRQAQLAVLAVANSTSLTNLRIPVSRLVDIGSLGGLAIGQQNAALEAAIGVMDLISAAGAVANIGNHFELQLSTNGMLENVLASSLSIAIGEPPQNLPWFGVGEAGEIVRTTQVRLLLNLKVKIVGGLLRLLGLTKDDAEVELPVLIHVASAEGRLQEVSCPVGQPLRVTVDAKPGIFEVWIGDIGTTQLDRFDREPSVQSVDMLDLGFAKVSGYANLESGNQSFTRSNFSEQEIKDGVIKTVSTSQITQSFVKSLFDELSLEVELLRLIVPVPKAIIESTVRQVLTGSTPVLDQIIYNLLSMLGVRIGEADVRVNGATCRRSVLVN